MASFDFEWRHGEELVTRYMLPDAVFELLTGVRPFSADGGSRRAARMDRLLTATDGGGARLDPQRLEDFFDSALAASAESRPKTAGELREQFSRSLGLAG